MDQLTLNLLKNFQRLSIVHHDMCMTLDYEEAISITLHALPNLQFRELV